MSSVRHWLLFAQVLRMHAALLMQPLQEDEEGPPLDRGDLTVRFTMLLPTGDLNYLNTLGVPLLKNAVCLMEKNFVPSWQKMFGQVPKYVIYTDSHSHPESVRWFSGKLLKRVRFVNLDEDPLDAGRMAPFQGVPLDPTNAASVRRTLADTDHLPTYGSRLLLGTDVSVFKPPMEFIEATLKLQPQQALYIADRVTFRFSKPDLYVLTNWDGPQCGGLLGDFIYVNEGVKIETSDLSYKMLWYMLQPVSEHRLNPPCPSCVQNSHGLHGIDQFAWVLALAEVVEPKGSCFALGPKSRHWDRQPDTEILHLKLIDDTCVIDMD